MAFGIVIRGNANANANSRLDTRFVSEFCHFLGNEYTAVDRFTSYTLIITIRDGSTAFNHPTPRHRRDNGQNMFIDRRRTSQPRPPRERSGTSFILRISSIVTHFGTMSGRCEFFAQPVQTIQTRKGHENESTATTWFPALCILLCAYTYSAFLNGWKRCHEVITHTHSLCRDGTTDRRTTAPYRGGPRYGSSSRVISYEEQEEARRNNPEKGPTRYVFCASVQVFSRNAPLSANTISASLAPKRFKSSYICFFMAKQPEIKEELGDKSSVTEVSKKSAEMWRNLPADERAHWDDVAAKDKQRYMVEKATYTGPWQVPWKRAKKDPSAPKRPMSAFLYFSQDRRRQIKDANPSLRNTEVSRILGELWRNASDEEKKPHVDREKGEREKYKIAIAEWRTEYEQKMEDQRKQQAEQAAYMSNMYQNAEQGQEGQNAQYQQQQYPPHPYGDPHAAAYNPYMHPGSAPYGYPPQYPPQMYRKSSSLCCFTSQPIPLSNWHHSTPLSSVSGTIRIRQWETCGCLGSKWHATLPTNCILFCTTSWCSGIRGTSAYSI
jgi:high mobility group protein B3